MKALVLAAGFGTRLYPLTERTAKPLLNVAGRPIIEHILEKIKVIKELSEVFIVTNDRFHEDFQQWAEKFDYPKTIKIINDGTRDNEDRLGAVGDLHFVLKKENIDDDLLVIAGDNLFGFSMQEFLDFFRSRRKSVVAFRDLKNPEKVKKKYGVGILEGTKVVDFQEKPEEPKSALASTACYIFTQQDLKLVEDSLRKGKADNPGDLVKYLVAKSEMHGFVFREHWFDIGSFDSLREAEEVYRDED